MQPLISKRASAAIAAPSPLVVTHFAAASDPYHSQKNPHGAINLGTAENYLMEQELLAWLAEVEPLSAADLHYAEFRGTDNLRNVLAKFLRDVSGIKEASADNIVLGCGVSSLLESVAFSFFDEGDSLLVISPHYTGYEEDFHHRFGVNLVFASLDADNQFQLDMKIVEACYARAVSNGLRVKAVLINSPNNPLGRVYRRDELEGLIAFAKHNRLHIIADEIYAHSVHNLADKRCVESLLSIGWDYRECIHVLYGLAKDFGLSGFKFALFYSENELARRAMASNAYFYNVSTLDQHVIASMFSDLDKVKLFLDEYQHKLSRAYQTVIQVNQSTLNAPVVTAQAGHFIFMDLSQYLSSITMQAERELFERIWQQARVNITPGQFFGCQQPGWFRVCFATEPLKIHTAYQRLARVLIV